MTFRRTLRPVLAPLASALACAAMSRRTRRLPEAVHDPWVRTNHAGEEVTLLEGPITVLASCLGVWTAGAPGRGPATLVLLVPGLLGAIDDHAGDTRTKGVAGHLGALRSGRVTTGAVKVAGVGAAALVAASLDRRRTDGVWRLPVDAVVIAGSANLVNLLDLRPGRALKVTSAGALLLLVRPPAVSTAGPLLGAGLAAAPADLAGATMLGDCGANALGGLLGLALVRASTPAGSVLAALGLMAATMASERVSFTRVIETTPVLREIDRWGRPR